MWEQDNQRTYTGQPKSTTVTNGTRQPKDIHRIAKIYYGHLFMREDNLSFIKMNCELMLTYDTPAYMFNVYKNQLSRQTGSKNLTDPKMIPTIWHTYMKLVTKYQISAINSC